MENGGDNEHRPWMFDENGTTNTTDTYRLFVNAHYELGTVAIRLRSWREIASQILSLNFRSPLHADHRNSSLRKQSKLNFASGAKIVSWLTWRLTEFNFCFIGNSATIP